MPPSGAREISEEDLAKMAGGEILVAVAYGSFIAILAGFAVAGLGGAVWAAIENN